MLDPRILAGPAMILLGTGFISLAARLWFVRPINRVWRLGPFVTERGMKAVLGLRFTLFAIGAFMSTQGLASVVFWFGYRDVRNPLVAMLGTLAAGLSIWSVCLMGAGLYRLWRLR